jgi:hypothetical protein
MPVRIQKLIESFLSDITLTIPELGDGCMNVRESLAKDSDSVVRGIVSRLGKFDESIVARNDTIFIENQLEVFPDVSIGKYWPELSESSKDTVWKYLNLMLLAGAKHIRALDRESKTPRDSETSNIAERLKDPELREKVLETIRETMESIPDETDEDVDPAERLKAMETLAGELRGTQIGKIVEEIAGELSGDIGPELLGVSGEEDLKKMGPQELMGLLGKPDLLKKIMGVVSKVGESLNKKMESGSIDRDAIAKEGEQILTKSQDLLKTLSPQAANMLSALQNGKLSNRKLMRAAKKMGFDKMATSNTRGSAIKERLRKKLEEKNTKVSEKETPVSKKSSKKKNRRKKPH